MPLTPKHDIYYPNAESQFTPLESHFAALATSVDDALIVQATETQTSVGNAQAAADAAQSAADDALDGVQDLDDDLRPRITQAQGDADAAAAEASQAKQDALDASNRIDTLSGEVDQAAQSAQDAWNLALEATADASQRLNLLPNPSYEVGTDFVSTGTGVAQLTSVTTANARASGTRALSIRVEGASASNAWVSQSLAGGVGGSWLGVSLVARRSSGPTHARLYVNWAGAGTDFVGEMWALPAGANSLNPRQRFAVQVPDGATGASVWLRLYGSAGGIAPLDGVTHTDAWMAAWADSEAAALTAVDNYFDGDTPDRNDAAGILYQTHWSGVPNESPSVETAYTAAMLEIIAQANAATQAALAASGEAGDALAAAGNALAAAVQAGDVAASKINTFYASTSPTAAAVGDLWIDTGSDPQQLRRWSGSAWVNVTDAVLQKALEAAGTAQATADGKVRTFAQPAQPGGMSSGDVGDLWIDTDGGNKLYRWSGSSWVVLQDTAIPAAAAAAANAASAAAAAAGIAEGKADVLIQSNTPTTNMRKPTTLWIDTTNGNNTPKRWSGSAWVAVTDKAVIDAAAAAAAADGKATEALNAAGGKNTVFRSVSLPGSTQGRAVGDVWWRFANSTLQGPIIGQWTWTGSEWRAATIDSQVIANLTVDKLVVTGGAKFPLAVIDTLVGDDAFFKRAMAEQIIVTPGNIIPGVDTILKDQQAGWSEFTVNRGDPSRWLQGRTTKATDVPFMVTAGVEYSFEVEVRSSVPGTSFYIQALPRSGQSLSQTYILSDQRVNGSSTTWSKFETTWTPSASGEIVLNFWANHTNGADNATGYQWFRNPTMRPRIGAIQLKNGAVTAPKIVAGALDSFQITSPKIRSVATANRGIKWDGNQLIGYTNTGAQAFHLDGTRATITGGTIQTSANANRGVKILSTGLIAYDNSGNEMIRLVGNTGEIKGVTITGSEITGNTSVVTNGFFEKRVAGGTLIRIGDSISFGSPESPHTSFRFSMDTYAGDTAEQRTGLVLQRITWSNPWGNIPPGTTGTESAPPVVFGGSNTPVGLPNEPSVQYGIQTFTARFDTASLGTTFAQNLTFRGGGGGPDSYISAVPNPSLKAVMNNFSISDSEFSNFVNHGSMRFHNLPTTAVTGTPVTVVINSGGTPIVYRNTSVRAAKTHIEDLEVDPYKVLELQPRTFYDKGSWERYADALTVAYDREHGQEPDPKIAEYEGTQYPDRIPGFIAEEVAELFPELASYDEQGNLVGVQYDRVSGHLLLAVRALKSEIDNLKENING